MAMRSMPSDPCAQLSSRTSMPLCSRYVRIASCDLSSMLFPMAVCLLVSGPAPLAGLVVRMAPAGEAAAQGRKRNADAPEFSEGCLVPLGKAFAALARGRPRASLRSQGGTGWGVRGGCPWDCGDEVLLRGVAYLGATGASGGGVVRWLVAVGFAGRRGVCVDAARLAVAMPMRCLGCFVPSRRARCGVWRLQCPLWRCI